MFQYIKVVVCTEVVRNQNANSELNSSFGSKQSRLVFFGLIFILPLLRIILGQDCAWQASNQTQRRFPVWRHRGRLDRQSRSVTWRRMSWRWRAATIPRCPTAQRRRWFERTSAWSDREGRVRVGPRPRDWPFQQWSRPWRWTSLWLPLGACSWP